MSHQNELAGGSVVEVQVVTAVGAEVAGDTTGGHALGYPAGKLHALRILHDGAVGRILHPKPVLIIIVVASFTLQHDGDRFQPLFRAVSGCLR